ncbi:MAG: cytochrome c [Acidobacteria bacterium]|nr:cytochrome c [Acidobacteriota bacterium]
MQSHAIGKFRKKWLGLGGFLILALLIAVGITYRGENEDGVWEGPPGLILWNTVTAAEMPNSPELLARGRVLYEVHCASCHGTNGDGQGPSSLFLDTPPRDFTKAVYKFRSSRQEGMPTDLDLFRTITTGLPAYGMPSFRYLSEKDRWALVHRVKSFFPNWDRFGKPEVLPIATEPPERTDSLARGKQLYETKYKCSDCHGLTGQGDGPRARELKDQWEQPISPRDFTLGPAFLKMGWHRKDTVRMLVAGIPGTPMPSQIDQLANPSDLSEFWDIARYVEYLRANAEE